jgi:hypothetical protein
LEYAVYIALPVGDDATRIAEAATGLRIPGFRFALRQHSDPSESSDAELFFRVSGVEQPEEALERALEIYNGAREAAGMQPDFRSEPSLTPVARRP